MTVSALPEYKVGKKTVKLFYETLKRPEIRSEYCACVTHRPKMLRQYSTV